MSIKKAREAFKEMINLCYEEDFPELHKELLSLEFETKRSKETYKYEQAMDELIEIIPLFTDDFPYETLSEIERIYAEFLEDNE
jgi:hypothetical protein